MGCRPAVDRPVRLGITLSTLPGNHWSPGGELLIDPRADSAAICDVLVSGLARHARPLALFDAVPVEVAPGRTCWSCWIVLEPPGFAVRGSASTRSTWRGIGPATGPGGRGTTAATFAAHSRGPRAPGPFHCSAPTGLRQSKSNRCCELASKWKLAAGKARPAAPFWRRRRSGSSI